MGVLKNIKKENVYFFSAFVVLAILGYFLFKQFADYTYLSERHYLDIIRSKAWVLLWISFSFCFLYYKRKSEYIHLYAIFAVSIYFIVLYGILFRGTLYGMNSIWGDNSYRLAIVEKMMFLNSFADPYLKGLPSMYPPLWFYIMAVMAKILNIEAVQTMKFGYLFIFLVYPWLIYFSWRSLVTKKIAAVLAISIPFFSHNYLDYVYYEHITACLFVPWWLAFIELKHQKDSVQKPSLTFYLLGILIGSLIFMTYYWWFFMALFAYPFSLLYKYNKNHSLKMLYIDFRHKLIIVFGIFCLTSIYWGPLLYKAITIGYTNNQSLWFKLLYSDISRYWTLSVWEAVVVIGGVFFLGYLWDRWKDAKLGFLFFGGFILIVLDRFMNLGFHSIQTRKFLEFLPLLSMIPFTIGVCSIWEKTKKYSSFQNGSIALLFILCLTISNQQTEVIQNKRYKWAIDQQSLQANVDILDSVDASGKVFLTNQYVEACYLPYYMFIQVSNTHTHFSGNFEGRLSFLQEASKIKEPIIFAYVLNHNCFDTIQYIYLKKNNELNAYNLSLNRVMFNKNPEEIQIYIPANLLEKNKDIKMRNYKGIFEVLPTEKQKDIEQTIREKYPTLNQYLI